jgi:hypothetical protein
MADRTVPVLNLDSLIDRPVVIIDGHEYQLLTQAILPPIDVHRLAKFSRRIEVLTQQEDLTAAEEAELTALPDRICRLLLEAPNEVHAKLTDTKRMEIAATFLTAPWMMPPTPRRDDLATPSIPPASTSTGVN